MQGAIACTVFIVGVCDGIDLAPATRVCDGVTVMLVQRPTATG